MEDHEKNPAGRIYAFLSYMNSHGSAGHGSYPMVAAYLEADQFTAKMYAGQALLASQPALMKDLVESLPNPAVPAAVLLDELDRIETALASIANPSMTVEGFRSQYDAGTLKSLAHTSHILNAAEIAHPSTESAFSAIRDAAEDLKRLVTEDAELDADVKRVLYEHVAAILRSLDLMKIGGVEIVLGEYDRMKGHLFRAPDVVAKIARRPKVMQGVLVVGQVMNALAAMINGGLAIDAGFDHLLLDSFTSVEAPAAPGTESV
ncbi:hypothetical protein [Agromyces bauzanensis]